MPRYKVIILMAVLAFTILGCEKTYIKMHFPDFPPTKEDVPKLVTLLDSRMVKVRHLAVIYLELIGPDARDAIPHLIRMLDDGDAEVRTSAIRALYVIGKGSKEVLNSFIKLLEHEDPKTRMWAASGLSYYRPKATSASGALLGALNDEDEYVQQNVLRALGVIGPQPGVVPALIEALWEGKPSVRLDVVCALGNVGPEPEVIDALIEVVMADETSISEKAFEVLGDMGPQPGVVPTLIEVLGSEDGGKRLFAAAAIGKIGSQAKEAAPILIEVLDDRAFNVRKSAIQALAAIGPEPGVVTGIIRKLSGDEIWYVRAEAAYALAEIGSDAEEAVPALADVFDGLPRGEVRIAVAYALIKLGWENREAAGASLFDALWHGNENQRCIAETIIPRIVSERVYIDETAVHTLIESVNNGSLPLSYEVAVALGEVGPAAKDILPKLIEWAEEKVYRTSKNAAYVLGRIGPEPGVVEALIVGLDSDYVDMRVESAISLGEIGLSAADALPKLRELAEKDPAYDWWVDDYNGAYVVREAAHEAITKIEGMKAKD